MSDSIQLSDFTNFGRRDFDHCACDGVGMCSYHLERLIIVFGLPPEPEPDEEPFPF